MRIRFEDIKLATNKFSAHNCIASGGFGTVYKAEIDHVDREYCSAREGKNEHELPKGHNKVSVKRIFDTEDGSNEQGFYAEIDMLTSCKNSNILTLLGFCDEGSAMMLIYEYASNGSLEDYLKNQSNMENDSWAQQIKIYLQVARGFSYLHTKHKGIAGTPVYMDPQYTKKGGFGTVYKAEIDHVDREYCSAREGKNEHELPKGHNKVAVKRIFDTEDGSNEQGFYAEIDMLTSCKNSNILTLLGFCDEGSAMMLIYEYASNGSLEDYLKNQSNMENDSWAQQIKICLQVARGFSYLHTSEGGRQEIVHRDIKTRRLLKFKTVARMISEGMRMLSVRFKRY
nr:kinase-like domain-containing protein [Tanacetum cinerariifolium]